LIITAAMSRDPVIVRERREALKDVAARVAFKLGVNPRTLERWEQGT
jgi:hypothetical protein